MLNKILFGDLKQACIRAAKPVNRLLRIAHHKYRRLAIRRHTGVQPCRQRLPLNRIGVLKFIEQNMTIAGIKPILGSVRMLTIAEQ